MRRTEEDIERGLLAVALNAGNTAKASRETGIPQQTLDTWKRETHTDRYYEIRTEKAGTLREQIAAETEDLIPLYVEHERRLLEQERVSNEDASSLAHIARGKSLNITGVNSLRDRPSAIVEHRLSLAQVYKELAELGQTVEGTALEAETLELDEGPMG